MTSQSIRNLNSKQFDKHLLDKILKRMLSSKPNARYPDSYFIDVSKHVALNTRNLYYNYSTFP
jgi:hypothetical protein